MVVTADPHATAAALQIIQQGGNAVDAAITAQWVLNVVEPQSSGIGGGGFFLYYDAATRAVYAFDGREAAPAEAYPEMFLHAWGEPYEYKPDRITGGLPVGVPGTLKLLNHVHGRFGSKRFSFAQLFSGGIQFAERGFPISKRLAFHIEQEKERLSMFKASRKILLDKEGNPLKEGTILFQPNLAKTFRLIQKEGINVFYEGVIAEAIVDAVRNAPYHPGFMQKDDLLYYRVFEREPVQGDYRGYHIFSMGPPSSGGTTLIEALNILELYHLELYDHSPDGIHLMAEAQKLAFQDRNRAIGDPAFVKVPTEELLSKEFAHNRAGALRFDMAITPDELASAAAALEAPNTSHISIVDDKGNMAAYTTTIEDIFGSAMAVPGYGFFLNNELTDFEAEPYAVVPDAEEGGEYQLHPNAPQPEKRPRSSMTPTFVFKGKKPFLIVGSPGGSAIIGIVLNVIVNVIDFKMSLEDALRVPRVINRDGATELEPELLDDPILKRDLAKRGHAVLSQPAFGNVQAILLPLRKNGRIVGESDPRGEGKALGY